MYKSHTVQIVTSIHVDMIEGRKAGGRCEALQPVVHPMFVRFMLYTRVAVVARAIATHTAEKCALCGRLVYHPIPSVLRTHGW